MPRILRHHLATNAVTSSLLGFMALLSLSTAGEARGQVSVSGQVVDARTGPIISAAIGTAVQTSSMLSAPNTPTPIVDGPVSSDPTRAYLAQPTNPAGEQAPADDHAAGCTVVDGRQIGCLAATNSLAAATLRQRAQTLVQLYENEKRDQRQAASELACFLRLQARHQQDVAAGVAMRAYYTRIAIFEQLGLSNESSKFLATEQENLTSARRQGLPIDFDATSFARRKIEMEDRRSQLLSQDRQLRSALAQLTTLDYDQANICQEQLAVTAIEVDCFALSHQAIAQRHDLKSWEFLRCHVNDSTVTVYAKMLGTLIGGWGLPIPKTSCLHNLFHRPDREQLACNLQRELSLTFELQRDLICQAVAARCEALKLAYQRMHLAQEIIASWGERIQQLERMAEQGDPQPDELANARSEMFKARGEEIARRLDARLAEVDLAEAVGCLHDRCCQRLPWLPTGS